MPSTTLTRPQIRYLAEESALFLLLTYFVIEGGVSNGVISFRLNQATLWILALTGAGWMGWRAWTRRPLPSGGVLDYGWLGILLAYAIATVFSTDPRRSVIYLEQILLVALGFFLFVDLLRAGWPEELLIKCILLTSLLPIALSLFQLEQWYAGWIAVSGWAHPIPPTTLRVSAFIANPNYSAAYLNVLLPLGIARAVNSRSRLTRVILALWSAVVLLLVFMTSSRGGWLGTMAALGTLGLLAALAYRDNIVDLWRRPRSRRIFTGAGALALLAVLAASILFFRWQTHSTTSAGSGLSLDARSGIWAVGFDMFRAHPITGNGPFTFGTEWIRHASSPYSVVWATAHNHLLTVAGETGILGVLALAGMLIAVLTVMIKAWRGADRGSRLVISGIAASLAGLAVHSQFDTPVVLPMIAMITAALLAVLAARLDPPPYARRGWASAALALAAAAALVGFGWAVWGYAAAERGVEASDQSDWQTSAASFDTALQRDPYLAFNWFQAGYTHGRLALNPDGSLKDKFEADQAAADYRHGLALEPTYAVNWANYAALLWASGDHAGGEKALSEAIRRASQQVDFQLTACRMQEEVGKVDPAAECYRKLLEQNPGWAASYFFRETPLRRSAADAVRVEVGAPIGWAAGQTESEIRAALVAYPGGMGQVQGLMRLGEIYSQQGRAQEAVRAYQQAVDMLEVPTSFGAANSGSTSYAWMAFSRETIAPDLLPGIDQVVYTDDIVQGMLDLGANYQKCGDPLSARRIYNKVIQVSPDNKIARERLAALG